MPRFGGVPLGDEITDHLSTGDKMQIALLCALIVIIGQLAVLRKGQKTIMEKLDAAITNETAILTEVGEIGTDVTALIAKETDLAAQITALKASGISEDDPRLAELLNTQEKV